MVQTRGQIRKINGDDEAVVAKADGDDEGKDAGNITENKKKRSGGTGDASSAGERGRGRGKRKTTAATRKTKQSPCKNDSLNARLNITAMNDEVTKVKTAKNCAQRWNALFMAKGSPNTLMNSSTTDLNDNLCAFDCSDLIVPPTHELVNREVERGIERWKDLASRVIVEEDGPTTTTGKNVEGGGGEVAPLRNHELLLDANIRGDKRKQRLMPYKFDYACKKKPSDGSATKQDSSSGNHCVRVISLLDPTKTLDYEEELWHVFNSTKTSDELERMHAFGNAKIMDSDAADNDHDGAMENVPYGCQHTLGVKHNLKEWFAKYSRMDAHSLGRLRIRERHSDPLGGAAHESHTTNNAICNVMAEDSPNHEGTDNRSDNSQTTIRFEILRHSQNLKRGSGPDSNRMEVELHGSQHTLLDLHCFLVECALNSASRSKESDDGNIIAGVFFIENTFYTCGEVGDRAGETIQRWLDGDEPGSMEDVNENGEGSSPVNKASLEATITPRRNFLGLSTYKNLIPMSKMKLEDLPLRLGVRYFHMFVPPPTLLQMRPNNMWSLANESAVYVTGIHTRSDASLANYRYKEGPHMKTKAPIVIHDTWAAPQRHFCLACNFSLASVVTVNDPLTDAMPPALDGDSNKVHLQGVAMCSSCYQALHYQPYNQQRGENDAQPLLELRPSHRPSLVFPIEDYQKMVTESSLDEIPKSAVF